MFQNKLHLPVLSRKFISCSEKTPLLRTFSEDSLRRAIKNNRTISET
eukprot:UN17089